MTTTSDGPSDDDIQRRFLELVDHFYAFDVPNAPQAEPADNYAAITSHAFDGSFEMYLLLGLAPIDDLLQAVGRVNRNTAPRSYSLETGQQIIVAPPGVLTSSPGEDSAGTADLVSRETKRRLFQAYVFTAVFTAITAAILDHEDAMSTATLFVGGSALQVAWYCTLVAGRAFDKLYPPENEAK
ncbi:hypothetical protein AB0395_38785 [Streptosporangium sp. NPDC051023]|uniref:hypothetical protein n=1 Tax=Streptosporangium sp. NPDC051023 TaxID=3155410 RepID=UPI00344C6632